MVLAVVRLEIAVAEEVIELVTLDLTKDGTNIGAR